MAERPIALDCKSSALSGYGGSNPSLRTRLSARFEGPGRSYFQILFSSHIGRRTLARVQDSKPENIRIAEIDYVILKIMKRNGFAAPIVLVVVLALLVIGGIIWVHYYTSSPAIQNSLSSSATIPENQNPVSSTTANQTGTSNNVSAGSQITVSSTVVSSTLANTLNSYFNGTSTWKSFNSTTGHFSASFPSYPKHTTTPVSIGSLQLNLETYGSRQSDGTEYAVNFAAYPQQIDTSNPHNNLEGSVNGSVQTTHGTLMSSGFSSFLNYPSIDYVIRVSDPSDPTGYAYVKGRNLLVGHNLYQILVEYEGKNSANAQFDKFANSFQLLVGQ